MTTYSFPHIPMEENKKPYKSPKLEHYYPQKAKGMSFFAFIFSIFVYISIFYIFNLSPSTLFKTTKFWFLISNTLILILAVDFGAFSSSKNKPQHDEVYDEYLTHRRVVSPSSSFAFEHREIVEKSHNIIHEQQQQLQREARYSKRYMQLDEKTREEDDSTIEEEKLLQVVPKEAKKEDIQEKRIVHVDDDKRSFETSKAVHVQPKRSYRRSKSHKDKRVVTLDENVKENIILKRSETNIIKQEKEIHEHVEEMNEFESMSDEDLHRRVEEFIQRFNRQIRLQNRGEM